MNLLCRDRLWRIEFWKGQRQQEREVSGQQSSLKGYRDTAETQKLVKSGGGGGTKVGEVAGEETAHSSHPKSSCLPLFQIFLHRGWETT